MTEEDRNPYLERLARLRAEGAIPAPSNGAVSGPVWWQMAYNQLRLQFDADQWSRWLRDMAYVDHEDGLIRLRVRTAAQREVVQYRLARNVRRVIADCIGCGMHEVEIEVVVEEVGR